ncbi:MAG: DUF1634 domain-containing protein [Pirellulales bacterium]
MADDANFTERLTRWVHRTLLAGVVVSAVLLACGLVILLGKELPAVEPTVDLRQLAQRLSAGDGRALLDAGLLVLMFTPVLRVLVLAVGWLARRDWRMAAAALTVLALLSVSVLLGVG